MADGPFSQLHAWYETALGYSVMSAVKAELNKILPQVFGQYFLQIGMPEPDHWLEACPARKHLVMGVGDCTDLVDFCGELSAIPLQNESVDAVFLPHTMEFAPQPQALIAEVDRILLPEGRLLVLGFNPWSLWRLGKSFNVDDGGPWAGQWRRSMTARRLLEAQGFATESVISFYYRPPVPSANHLQKLHFLESVGRAVWPYPGGLYLIVAKKKVAQMMPIKPLMHYRGYVFGKRFAESHSGLQTCDKLLKNHNGLSLDQ